MSRNWPWNIGNSPSNIINKSDRNDNFQQPWSIDRMTSRSNDRSEFIEYFLSSSIIDHRYENETIHQEEFELIHQIEISHVVFHYEKNNYWLKSRWNIDLDAPNEILSHGSVMTKNIFPIQWLFIYSRLNEL